MPINFVRKSLIRLCIIYKMLKDGGYNNIMNKMLKNWRDIIIVDITIIS